MKSYLYALVINLIWSILASVYNIRFVSKSLSSTVTFHKRVKVIGFSLFLMMFSFVICWITWEFFEIRTESVRSSLYLVNMFLQAPIFLTMIFRGLNERRKETGSWEL
jgi:hypothetical protein